MKVLGGIILLICLVFGFGLVWFVITAIQQFLAEGDVWKPSKTSKQRPEEAPDSAAQIRWYEVLGTNENCTVGEIREAYISLIRQYHPDRVADLGPEFRGIAEHRTKEINAAYHAALRSRDVRK